MNMVLSVLQGVFIFAAVDALIPGNQWVKEAICGTCVFFAMALQRTLSRRGE